MSMQIIKGGIRGWGDEERGRVDRLHKSRVYYSKLLYNSTTHPSPSFS